jgi:hypothetical protein
MTPNYSNQPYQNANFGMNYGIYPVQQKGITTVAIISGGYQSAESYPVAAGNTAVLMDFNLGKFWLKTTDIYGRPLPMEEYQFFKPNSMQQPAQEPAQQNQNDYVKKEDFNTVVQMVTELYKELKGDVNNVQPK